MRLTVIKLGGSVLTDKKTSLSFKGGAIKRLVREISQAQKIKQQRLILVLGAGGKAHKAVKKYELLNKVSSKHKKISAIKVHFIVKELQKKVVKALLNNNLPAVPFQTSALFLYNTKTGLNFIGKKILAAGLKNNAIPVLHGDFIFDGAGCLSILSGDIISIICAKSFSALDIIFVSDVDGVFDRDPYTYSGARLNKNLDLKKVRKIIRNSTHEEANDATGQMMGKLKAILTKSPKQKILIINGLKSGALKEALINGKAGTIIK